MDISNLDYLVYSQNTTKLIDMNMYVDIFILIHVYVLYLVVLHVVILLNVLAIGVDTRQKSKYIVIRCRPAARLQASPPATLRK